MYNVVLFDIEEDPIYPRRNLRSHGDVSETKLVFTVI